MDQADFPAMQGGELPRFVDKPWGGELWFAHTDLYAGKLLHVKAGRRLSIQYHVAKDETSYLLSGRIVLSRGPSADALGETELEPGGVWRNEPGLVHSVEALEDSVIIEVSTPELEDVVRLRDDYGRAEEPAERYP
jgi:mannose-6-phosphate isomerase